MKKTLKTKKPDVVILELPNGNIDMEKYVLENRQEIYRSIVGNIEAAVNKHWGTVEIFRFVGSNFVVVINRKDFKDNLQNAFDFSLENEHFETCAKAKRVMEKLDKISFSVSYKINPKKYNVKEKTPAKKATVRNNKPKKGDSRF